jgi:hypothetical protein
MGSANSRITGLPGMMCMAGIVVAAGAGMFAIGVVVGIVAVVSHGIHLEQKRFRGENVIWAGPGAPEYFLAQQAPDVVSGIVRRLNGLYVHHLPSSIRHDDGLGVRR